MSHDPRRVERRLRRALVLFALFLTLAALATLVVVRSGPAPTAPVRPTDPAPTETMAASAALPPGTGRTDGLPERSAPEAPPAVRQPTFEERVGQLAAIGARTAELAQAEDFAGAKRSDDEARQQFAALLDAFPDAGERGVAMLANETPPDAARGEDVAPVVDAVVAGRRIVLQLVIAAECERRRQAALAAADHGRIDPLVQCLLDVMPQATPIAEVGGQILIDRPYLRAIHEPAVLSLVQFAGEGRVPRPIATRLLLTLWDNLQRSGERTSDELSRLAMLLLADADPSKRTAACRQLLGDPRYRAMVFAWLRERDDKAAAAEVASMAARELEPTCALAVLRELGPILHRAPNAYMVLGARAPAALADAYRELLAANVQPGIRTDLVAGIGFARSAQSDEIVQLALQNDPSPEVRIQAAFAISASGVEPGERAIQQLLDDPVIARDPNRLGALVLALHNLEAGGDQNALDRLGRRLRAMPLSESGRQSLEALLARSLPAGRSLPEGTPTGGSPAQAR